MNRSALRRLVGSALAGVIVFGHAPANATTATTPMSVSATVLSTCAVTAVPLAFGNYDPTSATPLSATTTVAVTCTSGVPYNLGFGVGGGTGATVAARKLTSGGNLLTYGLYQNSGYSTVWGQTIGTDTVTGTGTGLASSFTVYGQIPAQQASAAGAYTDSVTATVTY